MIFHDQLPDGLIAQSVEHCTGFAEVMGSNPVQASPVLESYIFQGRFPYQISREKINFIICRLVSRSRRLR